MERRLAVGNRVEWHSQQYGRSGVIGLVERVNGPGNLCLYWPCDIYHGGGFYTGVALPSEVERLVVLPPESPEPNWTEADAAELDASFAALLEGA